MSSAEALRRMALASKRARARAKASGARVDAVYETGEIVPDVELKPVPPSLRIVPLPPPPLRIEPLPPPPPPLTLQLAGKALAHKKVVNARAKAKAKNSRKKKNRRAREMAKAETTTTAATTTTPPRSPPSAT